MSLSSYTRRTAAVLTLVALLPLTLPGSAAATRPRPRTRAAHPAVATSPASAAISAAGRSLAELWHFLTVRAADAATDPGCGLPTDDNGGMIDPNGKPKPAPPHP